MPCLSMSCLGVAYYKLRLPNTGQIRASIDVCNVAIYLVEDLLQGILAKVVAGTCSM